MNLKELGEMLGVTVKGPGDYEIKRLCDLERLGKDEAPEEHQLYFVENKKVLKSHPRTAEAGAVLTGESLSEKFPRALIAPDKSVRLSFIKLLEHYDNAPKFEPGVSDAPRVHPSAKVAASATILPGAVVMENAKVGENCRVFPCAVIEPFAEIGEGTTLYPNVVISHHCVVGKRCILHAGTVIGADGYGFYDQGGQRYKIPQIGNVVISDDVEMGAGCTVDRATIESTRIGAQTKFDDQVHVGHNCQVGSYIYIVGYSALGGSVVVEDGAMISGMVIVKDHLKVGKGSIVMGSSGVARDTEPGKVYFGAPARPAKQMHRMNAALAKLPELVSKVRELEKKLATAGSAL